MATARVRPYQPADEAAVRHLSERLTEGFAPWRDSGKVQRAIAGWLDDALAAAGTADHALLVADVAGHGVVGFIGVNAKDHYISGRDAYIGELAVDSSVEGQGIGRQLLSAAEAWAEANDCERLTLQTGAANERARRFYEGLGFQYEDVSMARTIIR